ncbi:MAG: hydrogenase iron-sulfur subunit [Chloroflexota bacterium]|nr:hydrogenase iron-sulfur subunit [Chloroflexota bacterium]
MSEFQPKIMVFCCNWCSYAGADAISGPGAKAKTKVIRTMCSGKVDPSFVLKAFSSGVDGVMLTVCEPGECHYIGGNAQAMRRVELLQNVLQQLGVEPERLKLERTSSADGKQLQGMVNDFAGKVAALGPVG